MRPEMPICAAASSVLAQRHASAQGAEDCETVHHRIEHGGIQFCDSPMHWLVGAIALDQGPKYHGNWQAGVHRETLSAVRCGLLERWREQLLVRTCVSVIGFDVLQRLARIFVKCLISELLVTVHAVKGSQALTSATHHKVLLLVYHSLHCPRALLRHFHLPQARYVGRVQVLYCGA